METLLTNHKRSQLLKIYKGNRVINDFILFSRIDMAYNCEECGDSYQKLSQLLQHRRKLNHWKKYNCDTCGKVFIRIDNLHRHLKKHIEHNHHCDTCGKTFSRPDNLMRHKREKHNTQSKWRWTKEISGNHRNT